MKLKMLQKLSMSSLSFSLSLSPSFLTGICNKSIENKPKVTSSLQTLHTLKKHFVKGHYNLEVS